MEKGENIKVEKGTRGIKEMGVKNSRMEVNIQWGN